MLMYAPFSSSSLLLIPCGCPGGRSGEDDQAFLEATSSFPLGDTPRNTTSPTKEEISRSQFIVSNGLFSFTYKKNRRIFVTRITFSWGNAIIIHGLWHWLLPDPERDSGRRRRSAVNPTPISRGAFVGPCMDGAQRAHCTLN